MKKTLLICTFLSGIFSCVICQDWFQSGAEWYYNRQLLLEYPAHGYVKYYVEKDTIINAKNAKLIIWESHSYIDGSIMHIDTIYMREINNQVFHWDGSHFKLMYDFTLNKGDTLNIPIINFECDSSSPITVDTITSIYINGTTLKVQHISFTFELYGNTGIITDSIIERIGRIESFIFSPACGIDITPMSNDLLRCYVDNEIYFRSDWWVDKFPESPCDTTIYDYTSIDLLKQNDQINIYPNPCQNFLHINHSFSSIISVQIFNSSGTLLRFIEPYKNHVIINIGTLESGIYALVIAIDNELIFKKLIKQ